MRFAGESEDCGGIGCTGTAPYDLVADVWGLKSGGKTAALQKICLGCVRRLSFSSALAQHLEENHS